MFALHPAVLPFTLIWAELYFFSVWVFFFFIFYLTLQGYFCFEIMTG